MCCMLHAVICSELGTVNTVLPLENKGDGDPRRPQACMANDSTGTADALRSDDVARAAAPRKNRETGVPTYCTYSLSLTTTVNREPWPRWSP